MKTVTWSSAAILVFALTASGLARADTVPADGTRFSYYAGFSQEIHVPIPEGRVFVLTDIVTGTSCTFMDGDVQKIDANMNMAIHLQTGIEFTTELNSRFECRLVAISGYWLDASAKR